MLIAAVEGAAQTQTLVSGDGLGKTPDPDIGEEATGDPGGDLALAGVNDTEAPVVASVIPPPGFGVTELRFVTVLFSESVAGVDAADLLVNGVPATNLLGISPREFQFSFPEPATGVVQVSFAPAHGITDLASVPNPLGGPGWSYTYDPGLRVDQPIISEFMAWNTASIEDEDGERPDWIELYNPSTAPVNLGGWYLTDQQFNRVKWRLPELTLGPNRYLLVFASGKDRATAPWLHTNFRLNAAGGYLGLVRPDGLTVASEFSWYPAQRENSSYGVDRLDPTMQGYFFTPTPGTVNTATGLGFSAEPAFNYESGVYTNDSIVLTITGPPGGTIRYTVNGTEPTNSSSGIAYTGPLTIRYNTIIKARVFQAGLWPSAVRARTFVMLDSDLRDFSSNLPLIFVNTPVAIPSSVIPGGNRARGSVTVIDTSCGRASPTGGVQFTGLAQFETFGQTSEGFPKKPHNIEINDEYGLDRAAPLLGMPAAADWKLRNPWSDKCLLNDFLALELFEAMGHYSCRRRLVEVFLNQNAPNTKLSAANYYGVMLLLEKIEAREGRVSIAELTPGQTNEPAVSGGYIFKRTQDSAGDLNFTTTNGTTFKMHEPKPRDLAGGVANPQVQWLRRYLSLFEASLSGADWPSRTGTNHYSHYIDVESLVDYHWIVEFTKNVDGYRLDNFFSKDREGKVRNGPIWDWNLAFGNANYLEGGKTNGWYYTQLGDADHVFLRRLIGNSPTNATSGDPEFKQRVVDRWGVLRTNILNGQRLAARIDELAVDLSEAAERNYRKYPILNPAVSTWPNPNGRAGGWDLDYVNPTNYQGIIKEMKYWTRGRYLWIDAQFVQAPQVSASLSADRSSSTLELAAREGSIYYTLDGTDPRLKGGGISPAAQLYAGPFSLPAEAVIMARVRRDAPAWGGTTWSGPVRYPENALASPLVISEIMYAPPPGTGFARQDFEFIEVRNVSGTPLDLGGYALGGGVEFAFPRVSLATGECAVVVGNRNAFVSRYGLAPRVLGEFGGALDNGGELLRLSDHQGRVLLEFTYSPDWHRSTAGAGFSLGAVDLHAPAEAWARPPQWRPSAVLLGTPGMPNPIPPDVPRVVVNEVVSSPAAPFEDAVELQNLSGSAVDIGGWFLSDDLEVPAKFQFPPGTVLPSGGYLALDEHTFNPDGLGWPLPGSIPFSFNADGDDVYLFSANAAGELTGYVDGFSFGPAETNRPFGRYVTSIGEAHVVALREITLLESNAEPQVGPLVISKIHYHPPDWIYSGCVVSNNTVDEFLELRNITEAALTLSDPGVPGGQWRLRNGVEYRFPAGLTLPPGGRVVVTGSVATNMWEWSAFRMRNGIADETLLLGPWEGALNNGGESVELVRPVVVRGQAAELLVERVRYSNRAPWPILADGLGSILQRRDVHRYADDPANWVAAGPGSEPVDPNAPPLLIEPREAYRLAALKGSVRLEVRASGASIAGYQWLHDGRFIAGATNADLVLEPVTSLDAGTYLAMVFAADGRMGASSFTVVVGAGANIYLQPGHQTVRVPPDPAAAPSTNAVFQVGAETEHPPLRYQWRFNGRPIEGATGSSLTVENVTTNDFGAYSCAVTDEIGTVLSASAMLYPIVQLGFLQRPVPSLIVTPGSVVALSCVVTGFPPPFDFEWRIGSVPLLRTTNADPFSIFTLVAPNVPATNQYRVVVRHYSNLAPGLPSNPQTVVITAVDTDGDGFPDLREDALPGFDKNNPLDALGDDDGDGMTNGDELVAGTDPRDPQSYLRLELPFGVVPGLEVGPMLSFTAISNRVYAVEAREGLEEAGLWRKVAEVPALGTNRVVTVQDRQVPGVIGQQIYRLVTPRQ